MAHRLSIIICTIVPQLILRYWTIILRPIQLFTEYHLFLPSHEEIHRLISGIYKSLREFCNCTFQPQVLLKRLS